VGDDTQHDDAPPTKREGSGRRTESAQLERGSLVGRYVVIDVLGMGGMGVVYTAYDPELDRKVAIKLLQAPERGATDQAWLLREAQAMARLAHPNVIAVHDVGTLPGNRVFVAMELVAGPTLRAWIKAQPRAWREVIHVMRQAGAGLAAAHHVGLVHRDFKPDNVLVGDDGRVRVMDFGLARLRADDSAAPASRSSDLEIETRSPLSEDLTIAGAVVGTPAYMAPELYRGEPADARTDQFSFGVALYEALFRVRPYDKGAFHPPPETPPVPRTPPDAGVPARVQRVVLRAIAADPKARYASMDELLAELAVDPIAHRKRLALGAAAMVAALGVGAGGYLMSRRHGPPPCEGIDLRLAGVWDAPTKAAVRKAFTANGAAFGSQAYASVEKAIDGYVAQWTSTAVDSCRATRVRGDQSEAVLAIRQACLDERLGELQAFTKLLADADNALVEKGDKAVWQLEPVAECSNVAALLAPEALPPELAPKAAELHATLAGAKAQLIAGHFISALASAQHVIDIARPIQHADGLVADAEVVAGSATLMSGDFAGAQKLLSDAAYAGMRSRRDVMVVAATVSLGILTSDQLGRPTEGKIWLGMASAAASHLAIDHVVQHSLLTAQGIVAANLADYATAIAAHQQALVEANLQYGKDSPALWSDEEAIAATMSKAGMYSQALPHFERALALREQSVGPDHPDMALLLSNMGTCYQHAGDNAKARGSYERALAIRERAYGANSPMLIATLNNMADQLEHTDPAGALPMSERSVALATRYLGKGHALSQTVLTTHAEVIGALGRSTEAHAEFDELLAAETAGNSPILATTLTARAELALTEKQYADAATYAQKAVAALEAAGGTDNPELWHPLSRLGEAELAQGHRDAAKASLDRALAIATKAKISEPDLAATRAAAQQLQ